MCYDDSSLETQQHKRKRNYSEAPLLHFVVHELFNDYAPATEKDMKGGTTG
jgi:hypothetical protein